MPVTFGGVAFLNGLGCGMGRVQANLPSVRREFPGLKMSQYRNMLRKDWDRSPQNPLNRQ